MPKYISLRIDSCPECPYYDDSDSLFCENLQRYISPDGGIDPNCDLPDYDEIRIHIE